MTHVEMILETLNGWRPSGPGPHHLHIDLGQPSTSATLSAAQTDAFSVLLTEMSVTTDLAAPCPAAELTQRAVDIANRVTGLVEPLKVYEVDSVHSKALLRSATPTERGGKLFYFELTLSGKHSANLKRYQISKSAGAREGVAFALTHEAVAKVISEVVGTDARVRALEAIPY